MQQSISSQQKNQLLSSQSHLLRVGKSVERGGERCVGMEKSGERYGEVCWVWQEMRAVGIFENVGRGVGKCVGVWGR